MGSHSSRYTHTHTYTHVCVYTYMQGRLRIFRSRDLCDVKSGPWSATITNNVGQTALPKLESGNLYFFRNAARLLRNGGRSTAGRRSYLFRFHFLILSFLFCL